MSITEVRREAPEEAGEETPAIVAARKRSRGRETGPARRSETDRGWYPADLVILAYLAVTGVLVIASPTRWAAKETYAGVHFVFLAAVLLLHYVRRSSSQPLHFVRHAYAFASLPFFYWSVEQFHRLLVSGYFDNWIVGKESLIFGCQPSQILHSAIPSIALSEFLHLSYLVYLLLVPGVALILYFSKRFAALKEYTTTMMATFLFCYAIFTIFPVRGPFYFFGPIDPNAKGVLFPQIVHRLLLRSASVGTAFPSSHVAAAVTVWIVSRRYLRRFSYGVLVIVVGIFVGTVYGGFHYALDALCGLAVGIAFGLLGPKLHAWICTLTGLAQSAAESVARTPSASFSLRRAHAPAKHAAIARRGLLDDSK